jgi:hypothetical protein
MQANNKEVRAMFNEVISKQVDPDKVANLELAREFFTNSEFRAKLQDYVWAINNGGAQ